MTEKPEVFAPVSPSLQPPAPSDETVSSKLREEYHTVQVLAAFAHETLHIASLNGLPAAKQQALQETLQRGEAWLQESQEALRSGEYHRAHTMIQQARETLSATQEQGMALGLATVITTINKEKESSAPETPPLSSASVIFVNAPTVNIRQGAGINQKILVRVRRGQKLSLLGQEGLWYHVETPSGHRGWIFKQLVTFSPP